jgi:hypothetical protein
MYDPTQNNSEHTTLRGIRQQRGGNEGHVQSVFLRSQRGGTSPVFQRLASRRSTEGVGQEVRRGETLE